MFYIYKITNILNNKIYIGQTYNRTIYDRFVRHCKEARKLAPSALDRAIFKYGQQNFKVELIEECKDNKKLNERERYWIKFFNSTNRSIRYNLTDGGEGSNTYKYKTEAEMNEIRKKIGNSNKGKNNGNHTSVKAININTNEVIHFDILKDCLEYFNIKNKGMVIDRCKHIARYYFRKEWNFAYENEDFQNDLEIRTKFNWRDRINDKCVSTIPDECKGVELEISTSSERKATDEVEHIVSPVGNNR